MQTLYYVRHGTSEFNLARRFGGTTDTPLAPEGLEQAHLAGERARQLRIDRIVTSPRSRCLVTAGIIADAIGYRRDSIVVSELLAERNFGPLEGTPLAVLDFDQIDGVETELEMAERAARAKAWLCSFEDAHVLVCSHGVFGRVLRASFHPQLIETEAAPDARPAPLRNAEINCFRRTCACCDHDELMPV